MYFSPIWMSTSVFVYFLLIESNKKIFRNKITAQDTLRSFADPPGTVKLPSKWQIHIHACDMYMNIWWVRCLSNECSSTACKDPCCEPWQTNKCLTCPYKHTRWGTLMKYFKLCISIWFRYTNSKIQFKYNYKENFLQTQEKM